MAQPEPNAIVQAPAIELPSGHIYKLVGSNWVAVSKDGSTVTVKSHPVCILDPSAVHVG